MGRIARRLALAAAGLIVWRLAVPRRPPRGLEPVAPFDVERYMGKWYEIARLDRWFEAGLTHGQAEYSPRPDGRVMVVNRGYSPRRDRWRETRGVARFVGRRDAGALEVSFFGPFYGAYYVISIDREGYRWAMVTGPSRSYLWILSRDPSLDPAIVADLVEQARLWGFPVERLTYVEQEPVRQAPARGSAGGPARAGVASGGR